jgi:hypothetical protein
MTDDLYEDALPPHAGLELLLRSLRKVLTRHGYQGEELEAKIVELRQRDFPRLTAAVMKN